VRTCHQFQKSFVSPDEPNACDCNTSNDESADGPTVHSQVEIGGNAFDHMTGGGGLKPNEGETFQREPIEVENSQRGPTDPADVSESDPMDLSAPTVEQGEKQQAKSPLEFFEIHHHSDETFFSQKIKTTSWTFIGVKGPKNLSLADNMPAFHDLLVKLMNDFLKDKNPEDRVQVVLTSKYDGKHPVSTQIMMVKNFSVSHIMAAIAGSVTSGATWRVSDEIEVKIKHVTMKDSDPQPSTPENRGGASRGYKAENASLSAKQRRCIVSINNDRDSMCAPRAIEVIKAKKKVDKLKTTPGVSQEEINEAQNALELIKRKPFHQARAAAELCQLAGIDPNFPCGVSELKKIEKALGIHIKVVCGDVFNEIGYDGVNSNRRDDVPVNEETVYFLYRTLVINDKKISKVTQIFTLTQL